MGRRGGTKTGASTEISHLWLGAGPLSSCLRSDGKLSFLWSPTRWGPKPPSFLPWGTKVGVLDIFHPGDIHLPIARGPSSQARSRRWSQIHLFPPPSPPGPLQSAFPAAQGEGSPSSVELPPSLTCLESWRQEGTDGAWRGFSRTKARRHQGMYF